MDVGSIEPAGFARVEGDGGAAVPSIRSAVLFGAPRLQTTHAVARISASRNEHPTSDLCRRFAGAFGTTISARLRGAVAPRVVACEANPQGRAPEYRGPRQPSTLLYHGQAYGPRSCGQGLPRRAGRLPIVPR